VVVHSASIQDRDGGLEVLEQMRCQFSRLHYQGRFAAQAKRLHQRVIEIVKRSDDVKGFKVLPKRWIVERTFGWFSKYRRLSKDYESLTESSEAMIHIAMINLMIHRLQPG